MASRGRLLAILCLLPCSLALLGSTCYFPDGKTSAGNFLPCSISGQHSSCCRQQESCLASGLCIGSLGVVYRGGCTDSTYTDGACPKNCLKPFEDQPVDMIACPGTGGQFWCGGSAQGVCNLTQQFYLKPGLVTKILPWASDFNANFAPGATATSSSTPSSSASVSQCQPDSTGPSPMIIGIVVGVPLLVLALTFFTWMMLERRKRHRLERQLKPPITPLSEILNTARPPLITHNSSSQVSWTPPKSYGRGPDKGLIQELPGDTVLGRVASNAPSSHTTPSYHNHQPPDYHRSYR